MADIGQTAWARRMLRTLASDIPKCNMICCTTLRWKSNYTFFDYIINETLFMTSEEHDIFVSLMKQIKNELLGTRDDSIIRNLSAVYAKNRKE